MMSDLETFRQQKNHFFKSDPHSPLTGEQKELFEHLNYYPENSALRFELAPDEYDDQEEVTMQTSTGGMQKYIRWGCVHFEIDGEAALLTLYMSFGGGGFFLPFMDATGGDDTYQAGRYLEADPLPDGRLLIDFNRAYNPYCAYNEPQSLSVSAGRSVPRMWSCPIPPKDNLLSVPIRAGEKKPTGSWIEEDHE